MPLVNGVNCWSASRRYRSAYAVNTKGGATIMDTSISAAAAAGLITAWALIRKIVTPGTAGWHDRDAT